MAVAATSLSDVSFAIVDLDNTLFKHWRGLSEVFGDVQVRLVREAAHEKGVQVSEGEALEAICASLERHGLGTLEPARRWGIDHTWLHRAVHQTVFNTHVRHVFAQKAGHQAGYYGEVREGMRSCISLGVKFALLTHGDTYWGQNVSGLLGVLGELSYCAGIDAHEGRLKTEHPSLFIDVARHAGYTGPLEKAAKVDDRPCNLRVPATLGMRPVLVGESCDWPNKPDNGHRYPDFLAFLNALKADRLAARPA